MRDIENDEPDTFDSQGKTDYRQSPRLGLSEPWKSRADGILGSTGVRRVNKVALCYLIVLLVVVGLSFQHHVSQSLKIQRLARSSKQWESLYSQSLEEIVDWKKRLEQEKKLAAEFAKNTELLEGTLKRVREEMRQKEEEGVRLRVDAAGKDKQREQLERKMQESEGESLAQLQEAQLEVRVKKLELEAVHRELEETKQAVKGHKDTIVKLNKDHDVLSSEQVKLKAAAAMAKNKTSELEGVIRNLRDELKNATRHTIYLEEHVTTLSNKNKVLETESRSKLDSTAKRMKDEVDAANARAEAAQQEQRALEERIAELESKLGQAQARVTELEEAASDAERSRASERERLQSEIREKEQRLRDAESAKRAKEEAAKRKDEEDEAKQAEDEAAKRKEEDESRQRREVQETAEREEAEKRKREEERTAERKTAEAQKEERRVEVEKQRAEAERNEEAERKAEAERSVEAERTADAETKEAEQKTEGERREVKERNEGGTLPDLIEETLEEKIHNDGGTVGDIDGNADEAL